MKRKKDKEQKQQEQQEQQAQNDTRQQESADSRQILELAQQIEDLKKEKEDLYQKLQRISADYINYQNRAPRQIADSVAYEKKMIIKSLLPSLDNFEHAINSAKSSDSVEEVIKGVKMIFDHMLDALKAHGVEPVDAAGEEFDPNVHEALMQRNEPDQEDNIVLEVFQRGYKLSGQVIRPSKVIVNKKTAPAKPEQQPEKQQPDTESAPQPQEEPESKETETKSKDENASSEGLDEKA